VINAPAQQIFDLLADPAMHPVLDGSGHVKASRDGNPARLSKGATFSMDMRIVWPYRIRNTVVEFEEGKRIGWRHFFRHVWRYELEPAEGGTKVTETFDYANAVSWRAIEALGYPKRNLPGMEATLERLSDHFAGASGT
jgi:hypothetical protein